MTLVKLAWISFAICMTSCWTNTVVKAECVQDYPYSVCHPDPVCENGFILPHPTDCSMYQQCNWIKWEGRYCSNQTEVMAYDCTLQQCVRKQDATCWKPIGGKCPDKPLIPPGSGCSINETCICEGDPVNNCMEGDLYPNSKDCRQYYLCLHGTLVPRYCTDGLYFQVDKSQCTTILSGYDCGSVACPVSTTLGPSTRAPSTRPPVYPTMHNPAVDTSGSSLVIIIVVSSIVVGVVVLSVSVMWRNFIKERKVNPSNEGESRIKGNTKNDRAEGEIGLPKHSRSNRVNPVMP